MNREEAFKVLNEHVKEKNLIKHCLATEVGMIGLARFFNEDELTWRLAGLLHDVDYEYTKDNQELHSLKSLDILKPLGVNSDILDAIETHNEIHLKKPISKMAKSLFCLDSLTGLIVASTLVLPSKKLVDVGLDSVLKKFKEKSFAKGANREHISRCEKYLDLPLDQFIKVVLESMQSISEDLGL